MRTSEVADAHRADTAVASQNIHRQKLRRNLCDRISDLARSDALLRRQTQETAAACAAESRESFNDFASTRLMRIAERACVRGADSEVRPLVQSALFFLASSSSCAHCSRAVVLSLLSALFYVHNPALITRFCMMSVVLALSF